MEQKRCASRVHVLHCPSSTLLSPPPPAKLNHRPVQYNQNHQLEREATRGSELQQHDLSDRPQDRVLTPRPPLPTITIATGVVDVDAIKTLPRAVSLLFCLATLSRSSSYLFSCRVFVTHCQRDRAEPGQFHTCFGDERGCALVVF